MARRSKNLFGFLRRKPDCKRKSSMSIREAASAARKAGLKSGDTGQFQSWLEDRGLACRSKEQVKRLRAEYEQGVEELGQQERKQREADKLRRARLESKRRATAERKRAAREKKEDKRLERAAAKEWDKAQGKGRTQHKGRSIVRRAQGEYVIPSIDKESVFDSLRDAKRFIDSWKQNPEPDDDTIANAAGLFKKFRGRKPTTATKYAETVKSRTNYAKLGDLLRLDVILAGTDDKRGVHLNFKRSGITVAAPPRTNPKTGELEGGEIYFLRGDQSLDLEGMGLESQWNKDHMVIGDVAVIWYHSTKDFHSFEPTDYWHRFAEEDEKKGKEPRRPVLHYDAINKRLFMTGGAYRVLRPGIVN